MKSSQLLSLRSKPPASVPDDRGRHAISALRHKYGFPVSGFRSPISSLRYHITARWLSAFRYPLSGIRFPLSGIESLVEFDVPIGEIEEILPHLPVARPEHERDDRPPFGPHRLADQPHPGLMRQAIGLPRIALDARTHDVVPRGPTAVVPRNDVVEVQFLARKTDAAILALVLVPLEHVVARELQFLAR